MGRANIPRTYYENKGNKFGKKFGFFQIFRNDPQNSNENITKHPSAGRSAFVFFTLKKLIW